MFLFDFARTPNGVRDERAECIIRRVIRRVLRRVAPGCRCAPPRATEPSSPTGWFGIGAASRICNKCGIGRPLGLPGSVAQMGTTRIRTPLGVRANMLTINLTDFARQYIFNDNFRRSV